MKVIKEEAKPKFQPVTISITLESEKELEVLREMFGYENTIPNMLRDEHLMTNTDRDLLHMLMLQIYRSF